MNADFYVVFAVRVIIVASGRACSLLAIPGHPEPLGCKSTMAKGRWEIRGQQPNPLCRNGSRDGSDQHWHRHTPLTLAFLEWFLISEYDGHSTVWGGCIGIHRDDDIALFPCALASVTTFCFEFRLGQNFFCFIVSQERVLIQALCS